MDKPNNPFSRSSSNMGGNSAAPAGQNASAPVNPFARGSNMGGNSASAGSGAKAPVNPFARTSVNNMGGSAATGGVTKPPAFGSTSGATVISTEQGLEVTSLNASQDTYEKRVASLKVPSGPDTTGGHSGSTGNYQEDYNRQKTADAATLAVKNKAERERADAEKTMKDREDLKRNTALTLRARELQNQIAFWKGQSGQGQYSDDVVNGTVQQLTNELNGIPSANR